MSVTRRGAQFQVDCIHLVAAREVLTAVDTVIPNLMGIVQVHRKCMVQKEFFTTLFTIRIQVLRTNVINTDHLFTGVWISDG